MPTKILVFIVSFFLVFQAAGQSSSKQATQAMQRALGNIIRGYSVYSIPLSNYGVGTSCRQRWMPKGPVLCDMIDCLGLSSVPENERLWKTVNGYAHYGQTGGTLSVEDSLTQAYGIALLLPKILKILNININVAGQHSRSVRLTVDSAVLRTLDYDKYKELILSGTHKALTEAYDAHRLLVATSDFVLLNYTLEINPVDSFGVSIASSLDSAAANGRVLNGKDSLGVRFEKQSTGSYSISSTHPVVFAVYTMKQKNLYPQGAQNVHDFKDEHSEWEENDVPAYIEIKQ